MYKMWWKKHLMYIVATRNADTLEVIGWLYLERHSDWQAWEVAQSFVFEAFRGQGWGKVLYSTVINREGLILASGYCQSRTARQMWKRMIASNRFTIWAHDFANTDRFGPVTYDPENDTIWSPLQVYDETWTPSSLKRNVRLIAIRKT
jgi:GNAT superfamily N-acetyltransferase